MYKLYTTPTFERKLKSFLKKHPDLSIEIENKLDLLLQDPFHPELKTHKLSGKLKNEWAVRLTYEYRILFVVEENTVFLTNVGSHEDIY